MPPDMTTSSWVAFRQLVEPLEVGPLEHAVTQHVGVDDAPHAPILEQVHEVQGAHLGALLPAVRGDDAAFAVDAHDEPRAEHAQRLVEKVEVRDGGGAQDDPLEPARRHRLERLGAAHAAAVLDGDADRVDDGAHDVEVDQGASPSPVEVDDVQRVGPLPLPLARLLHGVVGEDGRIGEVAAPQADGAALLDVDGGEQFHLARSFRTERHEVGQEQQPDRRALLWMELYRPDRVARYGGDHAAAVVRHAGHYGDGGAARGWVTRAAVDEDDLGRRLHATRSISSALR